MHMKQHVNISVYGKVQGVLYRFSARIKAQELGIFGFVQNMSDGSVYIEAEGYAPQLQLFMDWCRIGPPLAEIKKMEVEYSQNLKNFSSFESIRGSMAQQPRMMS